MLRVVGAARVGTTGPPLPTTATTSATSRAIPGQTLHTVSDLPSCPFPFPPSHFPPPRYNVSAFAISALSSRSMKSLAMGNRRDASLAYFCRMKLDCKGVKPKDEGRENLTTGPILSVIGVATYDTAQCCLVFSARCVGRLVSAVPSLVPRMF